MSKILDIKGRTDVTNFDIRADENISMKTGGIEHASINSAGTFSINNTNSSLSVTSGALVVSGGIGVGQNINVDNDVNVGGALTLGLNSTSGYSFPTTIGGEGEVLSVSGNSLVFGSGGSNSVIANNEFGTDNRMVRTVGTGKEIEATAITISSTGSLLNINEISMTGELVITSSTVADGITSGALLVNGGIATGANLDIGTTLEVGGTSELTGAVSMGSTLTVTSGATIGGTLDVTSATALGSTLTVTSGNTTLGGTLTVSSATALGSTLTVTNGATIGGTLDISGALTILNTDDSSGATTGASIKTSGGLSVAKNLYVGGDFIVEGTSMTVNSTTTSIVDPMFKLAEGNPGDAYDFGIYGEYRVGGLGTNGTVMFSGLHRVGEDSGPLLPEAAGKWLLFDNASTEPGALNVNDPGIAADLVLGELNANTVRLTSSGGSTASGSLTFDYATGSNYTLVFPGTQGSDTNVLINDGSGNLSWGNPTADPNFAVPVSITDTTDSINSSTGALVVSGGIGVAKNIYVGNNLTVEDATTLSGTLDVFGDANFTSNSAFNTISSSGIAELDELEIFNGSTFGGVLFIADTTRAGGQTSGSLITQGGVRIDRNLEVGETLRVFNTDVSTTSSTGALIVSGGVGIGGKLNTEDLDVNQATTLNTLTVTGDTSLTNLSANGRIVGKVRTYPGTGSATLDDDYILNVSAAATITLPAIGTSTYDGVTYMVVKTTASTVTIDATTTTIFQTSGNVQTLDMIGAIGERIMLVSNGTNWYTM